MRRIDLVKFSGEMIKKLHKNGIRVDDYQFLPMIQDYERMKANGEKTTYAVMVLSARYKMSERKIYKVLSRLFKDCQIDAA